HGANVIYAERSLAPPGSGWRVRIASGTCVQQLDHTELHRLAHRGLARDVRNRIVLWPLHAAALVGVLARFFTHRAFFTLCPRTGPTFLVVCVLFRSLIRLLFLLLLLGGSIEVLLD